MSSIIDMPKSVFQEIELEISDIARYDNFGSAVALSKDGKTAVIGASGKNNCGVVYVFKKYTNGWVEDSKLVPVEGNSDDGFGYALSISDDGNTILVGCFKHVDKSGKVYIFTKKARGWKQELEIESDCDLDCFGNAVCLSNDGTLALIGSPGANVERGKVHFYVKGKTKWINRGTISAEGLRAKDRFGFSLALSENKSTLLVGAYKTDGKRGCVYVFEKDADNNWMEKAKLTSRERFSKDYFGYSVALSPNGTKALIGACGEENHKGAVYLFVSKMGSWHEHARLMPETRQNGEKFGCDLAMTNTLGIVGSFLDFQNIGAAYLFDLTTAAGSQVYPFDKIRSSNVAEGDKIAQQVAIAANESHVLLSSSTAKDSRGVALLFENPHKIPHIPHREEEPEMTTSSVVAVAAPSTVESSPRREVMSSMVEKPVANTCNLPSCLPKSKLDLFCLNHKKVNNGVVLTISSHLPNKLG